jgi:hypothetical protein
MDSWSAGDLAREGFANASGLAPGIFIARKWILRMSIFHEELNCLGTRRIARGLLH